MLPPSLKLAPDAQIAEKAVFLSKQFSSSLITWLGWGV